VLAGAVLGVAFALLWGMGTLVVPTGVLVPVLPLPSGPVPSLSLIGFRAIFALGGGFGYTMLLTLLRFVVRREWAIYPLITGITLLALPPAPGPGFALRAVIMVAMIGIQLWALLRLGLLPMVVWVFTISLLRTFPLTSDLSAWYAKDALVVMGIVLALAIYGFRATLAGRPLWRDELAGG
jgi:hypothetical protein